MQLCEAPHIRFQQRPLWITWGFTSDYSSAHSWWEHILVFPAFGLVVWCHLGVLRAAKQSLEGAFDIVYGSVLTNSLEDHLLVHGFTFRRGFQLEMCCDDGRSRWLVVFVIYVSCIWEGWLGSGNHESHTLIIDWICGVGLYSGRVGEALMIYCLLFLGLFF